MKTETRLLLPAQDLRPASAGRDRLLIIARAWLALSVVCLLILWLVSLPEYFTRVTMLTVETYTQAGEVVASNELVQQEAAARGLSLPLYALYEIALTGLKTGAFWIVAALILWRAQNQWFGWYTALILAGLGAVSLLTFFVVTQPPGPVLAMVDLLTFVVWPAMFVWLFLFPGSGAVPRWAWWLVAMMGILTLALTMWGFLAAWGVLPPDPANLGSDLGPLMGLSMFVLVLYAQIYRYRRLYSSAERQQVKWFVFGMALLLIEVVIIVIAPPAEASAYVQDLYGAVLLVIPASIGISILRYRLWDIDVVIRKTLQYTVVTALLALIYFGSVFLLQRLFSSATGQSSPVALVVSTLLIAAIFAPLRRRIQDAIDRRFYRKKYDAQQVLAQFARTARDETDMEALLTELEHVIQETLQPEGVRVWLRPIATPNNRIAE